MSRSRKKHPWIKDHNPGMKQILNRAVRGRYRQITKAWTKGWRMIPYYYEWLYDGCDHYHGPSYPDRRGIVNAYDICDWKYQDFKYGYRK